MSTNKISVVIFQDGNMWAAQCVEYDIGAQAESLEKLHECLSVVIEAERAESLDRHGEEFVGISEAPERFRELYDKRAGPTFALCA